MNYKTYDVILENVEEQEARAFAQGFVFSECDTQKQPIKYARYIDTIEGIEIYYDYGADYYFFCPEEE